MKILRLLIVTSKKKKVVLAASRSFIPIKIVLDWSTYCQVYGTE